MSAASETKAYARAAEVGQRATRRRCAPALLTLRIEPDPVAGSPFWYWRVLSDDVVVADGWRLSWKAAYARANAEIVRRSGEAS